MYSPNPASNYVAVTPSDSTYFNPAFKGVYVGAVGDVTLRSPSNQLATFTVAAVPCILPFVCVQVRETGTTATNIVGLLD